MYESILSSVRSANSVYLKAALVRSAPDKHSQIQALYDKHMVSIADYCMSSYGGAGSLTMVFVRGLHKMLFPQNYSFRQEVDGKLFSLIPGEYRDGLGAVDSSLQPGAVVVFAPPAEVFDAMNTIVTRLNAALPQALSMSEKRQKILSFIIDFASIHPFGDANGRVMCMVCDLLLIKEGILPIGFCTIKEKDRDGLYRAVELALRSRDLMPLYALIERYNPAALLESIGSE